MSLITVEKYKKDMKECWDNFIPKAKNSSFLFYRDFMEYHSQRFDDQSLIVKREGNPVGLLPANLTNNTLISHQGLSYGGFIFLKEETLKDILIIVRESLKFLHNEGIENLIHKSIPSYYNKGPSNEIDYAFFLLHAKLVRRDISSVIFQEERLPYQTRRIRSIGKAAKLGVVVKEEVNFEDFWREILMPNLKEKFNVLPVHSLEEIKLLSKRFPQNIRQFNAYLKGELIAGTTIFENSTVAHAQYIASNEEGRETGAIDFLFDFIIQEVFKDKAYFSFGISNIDEGKNVNKGLLEWKESFGGRAMKHDFYEIKTSNYKLLDSVIGI